MPVWDGVFQSLKPPAGGLVVLPQHIPERSRGADFSKRPREAMWEATNWKETARSSQSGPGRPYTRSCIT